MNHVNNVNIRSTPGRVAVIALLVAVMGIVVQILSGVDYPPIPPGIIILLVAAAPIAFTPWRASPLVAVVVGLFLLTGFFVSGATANLADSSEIGVLIGIWIQLLSVIVATVAGALATANNYRTANGSAPR